jgi:hypothetical protein
MNFDDPQLKEYLEHFDQEVLPEMRSSKICFVLLSDHVDAKICLEVGAAVLLGKPMLVATLGGAVVPDNLRRFASEIIELKDGTPGKFSIESQVAMKDALERMITKGV